MRGRLLGRRGEGRVYAVVVWGRGRRGVGWLHYAVHESWCLINDIF